MSLKMRQCVLTHLSILNGIQRRRLHVSTSQAHPSLVGPILVGRRVRQALANGCPVVALESTVITHGLPEPQNLELALRLEQEIADGLWWQDGHPDSDHSMRGTVEPATIGVIKGQLVVGLTRDELEFLANLKLSKPIKASRRDISLAQAMSLSAGTTVSATMAIATSCAWGQRNQISVFATGGLGGVHLGGEHSMDVSADLYEMARSPIGLVSSGFKSFLDTRRSLELLETFGCTVTSLRQFEEVYSARRGSPPDRTADAHSAASSGGSQPSQLKTDNLFPGFFTTSNKEHVRSPWQCDSVEEAARILFYSLRIGGPERRGLDGEIHSRWLRHPRAMLLACPIPRRASLDCVASDDLDPDRYSSELLDRICDEIDARQDLSGKEKTPLILAELNRRTGGRTLAANLELLRNNARVGAHLAYEHSGLCQRTGGVGLGLPPSDQGKGRHLHDGHRPVEPLAYGANELPTASSLKSNSARPVNTFGPGPHQRSKSPLVVGCTMIDMHVRTEIDDRFKANPAHSGVTFNGQTRMVLGGVGRNLAAALELLGHEPTFVTSLARDNLGEFARNELTKLFADKRLRNSASRIATQREEPLNELIRFKVVEWNGRGAESSSCFALVLIDSLTGQCEYVIANLEARRALSRRALSLEGSLKLESLLGEQSGLRPPLMVMDANLPAETVEYLLELGHKWRVPAFIEPTDVVCLPRLVRLLARLGSANSAKLDALAYLSPNVIELQTMLKLFNGNEHAAAGTEAAARQEGQSPPVCSLTLEQIQAMARQLMETHLPRLRCLLVTMDKRGLLVGIRANAAESNNVDRVRLAADRTTISADVTGECRTLEIVVFKHYPVAKPIESPISASGAGDCFAAGFISGLINDLQLVDCVAMGFRAAACALGDTSTVPESLARLRGSN